MLTVSQRTAALGAETRDGTAINVLCCYCLVHLIVISMVTSCLYAYSWIIYYYDVIMGYATYDVAFIQTDEQLAKRGDCLDSVSLACVSS